MLDEDATNHTAIINAMRNWHTTNAAPPGGLGITANQANTVWEIDYGCYGVRFGTVRISRDNFEVTHVTDPSGTFVTFNYNHVWPHLLTRQMVCGALGCNTLATSHANRSIVILLCSECARSKLVARFVRGVLAGEEDQGAFETVKALTAEYAHTQVYVGGQVGPGAAWTPLELKDHLRYALHQRDDLKVVHKFGEIHELNIFLNKRNVL